MIWLFMYGLAAPLEPVVAIEAYQNSTCAWTTQDERWCWGAEFSEKASLQPAVRQWFSPKCFTTDEGLTCNNQSWVWPTPISHLSRGEGWICALGNDQKIRCVGDFEPTWGPGVGLTEEELAAKPPISRFVKTLSSLSQISGLVGTTILQHHRAYTVQGGKIHPLNLPDLASLASNTCGLTTDGQAVCEKLAGPEEKITAFLSRHGRALARTRSGVVLRSQGEEWQPVPVKRSRATRVSLALGAHHSCALSRSKVYCWGRNELGQLGDGSEPLWPFAEQNELKKQEVLPCVLSKSTLTCEVHPSRSPSRHPLQVKGVLEVSVGDTGVCHSSDVWRCVGWFDSRWTDQSFDEAVGAQTGFQQAYWWNSTTLFQITAEGSVPISPRTDGELLIGQGAACLVSRERTLCWSNTENVAELSPYVGDLELRQDQICVADSKRCVTAATTTAENPTAEMLHLVKKAL